jgi:hypothetical protein
MDELVSTMEKKNMADHTREIVSNSASQGTPAAPESIKNAAVETWLPRAAGALCGMGLGELALAHAGATAIGGPVGLGALVLADLAIIGSGAYVCHEATKQAIKQK